MEDSDTPAKPVQLEETQYIRGAPQESTSVDDYERQLTELEDLIESIGKKLRDLYFETLRLNRDDVARRVQLEDERTALRKQLIEASHQHKQLIQGKEEQFKKDVQEEREQRQHELEEAEKKLEAEREERRRAREEEISKLESSIKADKQTIHESHVVFEGSEKNEPNASSEHPAEESSGTAKKEEQSKAPARTADELSESRYRLRVAEIETELALSSLRRSRRISLDVELAALRSRYSYYPYYPYYRYPLYGSYGYYGYYGFLY